MEHNRDGKLLYHFTDISNLPGIFSFGLMSRAALNRSHLNFSDNANHEILSKRANFLINGDKRIDLAECVPFHFKAKTPFDYALVHKASLNIENLVYITIPRTLAAQNPEYFFVIPRHPVSSNPPILPYNEGIQQVLWDDLDNRSPDSFLDHQKNINRMAECIALRTIRAEEFLSIYVYSETTAIKVNDLRYHYSPMANFYINVNPNMFPSIKR
ncbi:MAG: DUF4433 domain-containing protein [Proteobacteria bacterium]|uniref:DUF4433 domain-containing protein n=1 Tax=Candidatus Avisuccinivibrio stercorigallinarum TaxID=2840704 RepID=A0A9D9D7M5_9GAMM|nr:DUF4433 domain-containing protein [Candidatus Avisuccinivibrio stercorigallinarum]